MIAEVFAQAKEKVYRENESRRDLGEGAFLSQVFAKYGVL
jgi:hypothetical protein